jgi:16S rRNA (guanine1516-N2)-methyltransferase
MEDLQLAHRLAAEAGLELVDTSEGLALTDGEMELRADFAHMLPRIKQGRLQQELLVRAARVRGEDAPVAVDATAGFGEDSLLLAAAGFTVHLFECNAVIAALLADALERAAAESELAPAVSRMHLHVGDSISGMSDLCAQGVEPHVVYLDPMFPGRTKSAAVKKKFQLLHHLEQPCADEEALMQAALACASRKVVVKRPVKGPLLAGAKPSSQLKGKAVRYDIVIPPQA